MKTYPQIKKEIIKEFHNKFGNFRGLRPDGTNQWEVDEYLSSSLDSLVKQTLEGVEMEKNEHNCNRELCMARVKGWNDVLYQFNQKKEKFLGVGLFEYKKEKKDLKEKCNCHYQCGCDKGECNCYSLKGK